MFVDLPQEILLHIFSFLDLPDLAALARAIRQLASLAADPVLHSTRLRVITPSRVDHSLFGRSPQGIFLRPTVQELVQRGVMRGLHIERRWRMGGYLYSPHWVKQYENGLRLNRQHTRVVLSAHLRSRPHVSYALKSLHYSHVLPDAESSTLSISRTLLPVVHQLKWSIQKDRMARIIRGSMCGMMASGFGPKGTSRSHPGCFGAWIECHGQNIFGESERLRLALCPDVRKIIQFYEKMAPK
ncbi:hypothetical protein F5141DRAFT_995598 [Pisolithus sp. B1]|nr:hypothetical protein EV401DRAFT_1844664 [Pisolithus croceorrhizus]KAI6136368.1 hypothetical protein F5141DRAFT_995598 [Pisolithus sp. B1]